LLYNIAIHGTQLIMLTPLIAPLHLGAPPLSFTIWALLIEYGSLFFQLYLFEHYSRFEDMDHIDPSRMLLVSLALIIQLYIKNNLAHLWHNRAPLSTTDTLYPLLIVLLIDVYIVVLEKHFQTKALHDQAQLNNLLQQHQIQMLQTQIEGNRHLLKVHHDIKNHLSALSALINEPQQAQSYIHQLMDELMTDSISIQTGNSFIDNLLSLKLYQARKQGIHTQVLADLSPLDHIVAPDLCILLGNAMDNAIEAAQKEPNASRRFISLKSQQFANQLLIHLSNTCAVPVSFIGDQPLTTKKPDGLPHGIGYRNIKDAAAKYDGFVSSSYDAQNQRFNLTIMFPLS